MHIVTASDDNYAHGVMVLLSSLIRHNPNARFTVLATGWTDENLAKFHALGDRLGTKVQALPIADDTLGHLPFGRSHITASTYARLLIPDLLPDEDRVIYMDGDMLVTGSLDAAWTCDLTDKLVAAVRCPSPTRSYAQAIDLPLENYFNAGFLSMNLDLWRKEATSKTCFDRLTDADCPYLSQDESAVNDVARDRVLYLPSGFNVYARDTFVQDAFFDPPSIRVIHYMTRPKPWDGITPFYELWRDEWSKITELADWPNLFAKDGASEPLRVRLSKWNGQRKEWMGRMAGRKKYELAKYMRTNIHEKWVPHFLDTGRFPES
ncbi:MAG: glycosyltransferase family 8 protein [Pseudomonadota bacterium]